MKPLQAVGLWDLEFFRVEVWEWRYGTTLFEAVIRIHNLKQY